MGGIQPGATETFRTSPRVAVRWYFRRITDLFR